MDKRTIWIEFFFDLGMKLNLVVFKASVRVSQVFLCSVRMLPLRRRLPLSSSDAASANAQSRGGKEGKKRGGQIRTRKRRWSSQKCSIRWTGLEEEGSLMQQRPAASTQPNYPFLNKYGS